MSTIAALLWQRDPVGYPAFPYNLLVVLLREGLADARKAGIHLQLSAGTPRRALAGMR